MMQCASVTEQAAMVEWWHDHHNNAMYHQQASGMHRLRGDSHLRLRMSGGEFIICARTWVCLGARLLGCETTNHHQWNTFFKVVLLKVDYLYHILITLCGRISKYAIWKMLMKLLFLRRRVTVII